MCEDERDLDFRILTWPLYNYVHHLAVYVTASHGDQLLIVHKYLFNHFLLYVSASNIVFGHRFLAMLFTCGPKHNDKNGTDS